MRICNMEYLDTDCWFRNSSVSCCPEASLSSSAVAYPGTSPQRSPKAPLNL